MAVMCERWLAHLRLGRLCWGMGGVGIGLFAGSGVAVFLDGWLCVSGGWHIVGWAGCWVCGIGLFAGFRSCGVSGRVAMCE